MTPPQLGTLLENIDLVDLREKNKQLVDVYKDDLAGVLRYLHFGQILPLEIEKSVSALIQNMRTLKNGQRYRDDNGDVLFLIEAIATHLSAKVTYINQTTGITYHIEMEYVPARDRNEKTSLPYREIFYKNKTYRAIKEDGDVYAHLNHQHLRYVPEFLVPLHEDRTINNTEFELLELFHRVHDVPERHVAVGDKYAFTKEDSGSIGESHKFHADMIQSRIPYTPEECKLMPALFKQYEGRYKLFKLGEMLGYMKNGFSCLNNGQYFNGSSVLWSNLVANVVEQVLKNDSYTMINTETWEERSYKPLELRPIREFFTKNANIIQKAFEHGMENAHEIDTMQCKTRQREQFEQISKSFENEILTKINSESLISK